MAVGKTIAVKCPYVNISYEINTDIIYDVKRRKLDKNKYENYLAIQKLCLNKEIVRWKEVHKQCSIMDFGTEEI